MNEINKDITLTDCFTCSKRTICMETRIYDYQSGGIIEKIKAWMCLDCLEKWRDTWSNNSLYFKERGVDDDEVLAYSAQLDVWIKSLRNYLYH